MIDGIAGEFVGGNEHTLASLVILYIYEAFQMYQSQFRINSMILGANCSEIHYGLGR